MFVGIYQVVMLLAFITTYFALRSGFDRETRIVFSVIGFMIWMVIALNSGNVTTVSGGEVISETYTSLIIVGAVFAIMNVINALMLTLDTLRGQ